MKKIAFTLYMISIIIMLPLYVILELKRENTPLTDLNPVSIRNEKLKTPGDDPVDLKKSGNVL